MGLFDKAKKLVSDNQDKIDDVVEEHGDKIADGVDKVDELAEEKLAGDQD